MLGRLLFALTCAPLMMQAQTLTPVLLTELPLPQQEVSGILCVDGMTWICLDSGNPNRLYQVDTVSGDVLRELELTNASNVDWEELTTDGEWVYVGDFGNNAGARTDLRVYRFPLEALSGASDAVEVDTIRFHYADQSDFTPVYDGTNWDAEAFLAFDDSLFLFTKNWVDERTHLYVIPALPGDRVAVRRDEFDTQGLITGAARDAQGDIVLLGHSREGTEPFVWTMRFPTGHALFSGSNTRHPIALSPLQAEAIGFLADGRSIIGNERTLEQEQALWTVTLPVGIRNTEAASKAVRVYPVPADRQVHVEGADPGRPARVLELNGTYLGTVTVGAEGMIDLPPLVPGEYVLDLSIRSERFRLPLMISR
ncbi:MAG: hypothetical protein KDB95_04565 [Flavobacteriales bacterium]|nr:hypothetical protein [Flavobacteriales bacterium]